MRPVLRLLGTRYGIAILMMVLGAGIVLGFRGYAGTRHPAQMAPALEPSRAVSVQPSGGFDGAAEPDDGEPSAPTIGGSGSSAASTAATRFIDAWLAHRGVTQQAWRTGLTAYATPELMAQLAATDPAVVPADRRTGQVTLLVRDEALVEASAQLDTGKIKLQLTGTNAKWLVSSIDWEPSR